MLDKGIIRLGESVRMTYKGLIRLGGGIIKG